MANGFKMFRAALSGLAGQFIDEHMFMRCAPDNLLCRLTKGKFTGNNNSHPVFILKKKSESFMGCPCTSQPKKNVSYIPQGIALENSEPPYRMDRTSYILHFYPFVIPKDGSDYSELWGNIHVRGKVPLTSIVGSQWK